MSTHGLRPAIFFIGILGLTGGCASVPPTPSGMADQLPGAASGTADSRVVPASATEPAATSAMPPPAEEEDGFELSDLAPKKLWNDAKEAAGYGPDEGIAGQLFQEGKALYDRKEYSEAAGKFKSAAKRWPDSILEEDALFMLGESYFHSDQYPKAQDAFDNLLNKYDNSRHLDVVSKQLFAIGQYWEQLDAKNHDWPITPNLIDKERPWFDTFGNAIKCYETVRLKDPTGPHADDAVMATATAYFRTGRYEDAAYNYGVLISEYSNSEHQAQAHMLGLQSKLRVYQGPRYDRTPLEEAEKLADQVLTQFPGELGDEKTRMTEARDGIAEQIAERDWNMAQYYDNKKQYGAARVYYHALIEEHPLSQAARKARQRLEEIRDEPDNRPKRFRWLTDVFEPED